MDISIYKLKTKFQNLLMPICEKLVKLKITPNQITVTTVLLNIIFAGIIYKFSNYNFLYLTVPIFLFLRVVEVNEVYNLLFIFLSALSEYIGVVAVMVDNKRHYEGPMGKSDRAFLISLLAIIYFFVGNQYFDYILILAIILLIFTIYNRVKSSLRGE